MRIVLLNHYAGAPALGMEFRPYYLAREWVRMGHAVQIVAADFSHVRARQPRPGDELIDGIRYRWVPTPRYHGNGLGRAYNIWSFLRTVRADAPRLQREFRPDVVIASSTYPMDIWVARRIARPVGAKLVYEVHDLWPLSPIELSGMSPRHPFIRLVQAAEDAAYRDADAVVSMLPKVHDYMASRGLDLRKLHIVPNGIAPDDWLLPPPPLRDDVAQVLAQARQAGRMVVGYAGSMGLPNALDSLLDAAALLRGVALQFVLVGDGHERARLARRIADEQLQHVAIELAAHITMHLFVQRRDLRVEALDLVAECVRRNVIGAAPEVTSVLEAIVPRALIEQLGKTRIVILRALGKVVPGTPGFRQRRRIAAFGQHLTQDHQVAAGRSVLRILAVLAGPVGGFQPCGEGRQL